MKSRLFKNSESLQESFKLEAMKSDLSAMLSIGTDGIPAFVRAVGEILNAGVADHERIVTEAAPRVRVDRSGLAHACNAAGWLATEFYPNGSAKGDTPEDIADDMIAMRMITEDQRGRCAAFLSAIKVLVQQELWSAVEQDRALQKGAPGVVGVQTALFFRNVFRKPSAAR